jgi:hypothetical protein
MLTSCCQVTFRGALKNQYEEVLFQCEDDRYELDLVVCIMCGCVCVLCCVVGVGWVPNHHKHVHG